MARRSSGHIDAGATQGRNRASVGDGQSVLAKRSGKVSRAKATARESSLVERITARLRRTPYTYVRNIHGGIYQAGLPDLVGCHRGRFFAIECKRNGQRPTPLQVVELAGIAQTGGAAQWFDEYTEFDTWWAEFVEQSGG